MDDFTASDSGPAKAKRIIYLAHGGEKYVKQARYSIHTLLYWLSQEDNCDIRIIVYTDDASWLPQHASVTPKLLSAETIREYIGPFHYIHRVKLAVLADAQRECDLPTIFVDCDTKWCKNPSAAFRRLESTGRVCFMHQYEGEVSPTNHPAYFRALNRGFAFQKELGVEPPWSMWNSGTIGIPAGAQHFFADSLVVTDAVLADMPHSNWVEQLAVSVVATRDFEVLPFEDYLLHFWQDSAALPTVLDKILPQLTGKVTEDARLCAQFPFDKEVIAYRRTLRGRAQRKLAKLKRSIQKRTKKLKGLLH